MATSTTPAATPTPQDESTTLPAGSTCTSPSTTTAASPTPKSSPDEKAKTAVSFLHRTAAFYRRHGIRVEAILTDNGPAYISIMHALACRKLQIKHLRTRPYRPQTNGKAERFIRTMLAGWAYGALYSSSHERTTALDGWLWHYNHRRRHSALGHQAPITRTNLLGSYT